jgi:hypothetical protein
MLAPGTARSQYLGCQMGFLPGQAPLDNQNKLILTDSAWSDASILESGSPNCAGPLMDWVGGTPVENHLVDKQVSVYTKQNASNLYFRFVVHDSTTNEMQPISGGPLPNGEKIVIELDPQNLGGVTLPSGADYRLDIVHKWSTGTVVTTFYNSTLPPDTVCLKQQWQIMPTPTDIQVALDVDSKTQYTIGIQIPFGDIGNTVKSNFGVGFIIVNDLGYCDQTGQVCKATATSFPFDPGNLAITNSTNTNAPTDPVGCGNWLVPNYWGGGPFNSLSGGVTISRLPYDWLSDAITVFSCGTTPNYQYYPDPPCKLTIQAVLNNTTGTDQVRNILFLWGDYGTGQLKWRYVDLQQSVTIPAAGGPVTSILWTTVPRNLPEHPCVRVYILPATLLASFSATDMQMRFDTPGFTAADLETAYSLGPPQWAQKNISVATSGTMCPLGCGVASRFPDIGPAPAAFNPVQASISLPYLLGAVPLLADLMHWQSTVGTVSGDQHVPIYWPSRDKEQLEREDAAIQVRAVCSATAPASNKTPRYDFLEDCGGVLKLIPSGLLGKKNVPFIFNVSNSAKAPRTIFLNVATYFPPGVKPGIVLVDTTPYLYQPGETRTITGGVLPKNCWQLLFGTGLPFLFVAGLCLLGLLSHLRRGSDLVSRSRERNSV